MKPTYDIIADKYDTLFTDKASLDENKKIMSMIKDAVSGMVMDIGCGTGLLLDYLKIPPKRYIGVDESIGMLHRLLTKHPGYIKSVRGAKYELFSFPKVDFIVSLFGSISYINKPFVFQIPDKTRKYFLMFYKPDYFPVTYIKTGVEFEHNIYHTSELERHFKGVIPFNNYYIVTNL